MKYVGTGFKVTGSGLQMRRRGGYWLTSVVCVLLSVCSGNGNVDLSKATKLTAEPVETPKEAPVERHPLFNFAPGTPVAMKSLGTIDRTNLSIENDYDGDGIPNNNSTNPTLNHELHGGSNQWVSDYPIVEASVAPPVIMKIQVIKTGEVNNAEIVSQINSDDYEEVKEKGTEKVHQNELNARTTQIQDYRESSTGSGGSVSSSSESEANGSLSIMGVSLGGGGSSSSSSSSSWANKTSYGATKTTFPTIPYKNNLDRDAVSLKSDAAARNARKYRVDRIDKKKDKDRIEANAGIVRAALYIKNLSGNMPVRLTNILCTFMFEANNGQLIPVQSFRLRNDDYSLFSVNIYGGSEFGPYVVELPNLNTAEIERALQLGFNPKIFIVDYEMTHVPNSSYKNVLTSYQGDNLKIVEENAKGRTAIIKIKGPQMREMYRVAAFSVSNESPSDTCAPDQNDNMTMCPGVSMRKALQRIRDAALVRGEQYYATNIEYQDYIFDFGDEFPLMKTKHGSDLSKMYLRTVKTIGSVSNRVECEDLVGPVTPALSDEAVALGINGIPVCKAKPFSKMTENERQQFGIWVVFADGKFYTQSEFENANNGAIKTYAYTTSGSDSSCPSGCTALVTHGIDGTVWVGDSYDWVYLTLEQFLFLKRQFGNNPLETGEVLSFNTKWDLGDANTNVFDPQYHSKYLGQAVLGDQLEIVIDLKDTKFLNPKFHADTTNGNIFVQNFSYDPKKVDKKFSFEEAIDFEVNLGIGDKPEDWGNIIQPHTSTNAYFKTGNGNGIKNCGKNLDYLAQQFKICVQLPASLPNASADGRVNVYLRPILHNAYRNTVWPKKYTDVNKFQGELAQAYQHPVAGVDLIRVSGDYQVVTPNTDKFIFAENGYRCEYTVSAITPGANATLVHVTFASSPSCTGIPASPPAAATMHSAGLEVGVRNDDLTASEVYFSVSQNIGSNPVTNYFHNFNAALPTNAGPQQKLLTANTLLDAADCAKESGPLRYGLHCFGMAPAADDQYAYLAINWLGGADSMRAFNDARKLRDGDYLTSLASNFYGMLNANSMWRIFPFGILAQNWLAKTSLIGNTLDENRKNQLFRHLDRTLMIWETASGNNRSIWLKVVNNQSGQIIVDSMLVAQDVLPNNANSPEIIPFAAKEQNGKITVAYGITWREQVQTTDATYVPQSYYDGQFRRKSSLYTFDINLSSLVVDLSQISVTPVLNLAPVWLRSYDVAMGGMASKKYIAYSTNAYSWQTYHYGTTANHSYYYHCLHLDIPYHFYHGCTSPYGCQCTEDCTASAWNADGIYDGNGSCIYPPYQPWTAAGVAVGGTVLLGDNGAKQGVIADPISSDGADRIYLVEIVQDIASEVSTKELSNNYKVDRFDITQSGQGGFVWLKEPPAYTQVYQCAPVATYWYKNGCSAPASCTCNPEYSDCYLNTAPSLSDPGAGNACLYPGGVNGVLVSGTRTQATIPTGAERRTAIRYVGLISPVIDDANTMLPYAIESAGGEPIFFGANSIAMIAYAPDASPKHVGLLVTNLGQATPLFYGISGDGKLCTSNRCASMRKYAPYSADVLWLEDDAAQGARSLYHSQVTIYGPQDVLHTSPRFVTSGALESPESLMASERLNIASWVDQGIVYAKAFDKQAPPFLTNAIPIYSPGSGVLIRDRLVFDNLGNFYVTQTSGVPGVLSANIVNLNPATAFTPKYGLNNFFASPLIERNYTATARVLIR